MSTANATEYERGTKALEEAQRKHCAYIRGAEPCLKPRAKGDHLCDEHRDAERARVRAELPPPGVPLVCDGCRERPTKDEAKYSARKGGTHYRKLQHGAGIPGHADANIARTCGTWVLDEEVTDGR
jgi:hypothetical protein